MAARPSLAHPVTQNRAVQTDEALGRLGGGAVGPSPSPVMGLEGWRKVKVSPKDGRPRPALPTLVCVCERRR